MDDLLALLRDTTSVPGRLVSTAVVVVVAVLVAGVAGRLVARRYEDSYGRYYARKLARYAVAALTVIALAVLWRPFAGRIGVVLGLATAGIAFAMQEVIGALAGWVNILSGRVFRPGDRIEMAGVRGDVLDLTPLRTKILEIGGGEDNDTSWVRGRQYTGRIVAISNKASFTEPVYNFTAAFDYLFEEFRVVVPYRGDWRRAERILAEEVTASASSADAERAFAELSRHYPVPRTELEPRVFVRATDNWVELAARFVVPLRTARAVKDELTRRVLTRYEQAGIDIASATVDATLRFADDQRPVRPTTEEQPGDGDGDRNRRGDEE